MRNYTEGKKRVKEMDEKRQKDSFHLKWMKEIHEKRQKTPLFGLSDGFCI